MKTSCKARLFILVAVLLSAVTMALDLPSTPLVTNSTARAPLNLLVIGRDHNLFVEAYNDASDLDGDNLPDIGFKPAIAYYGYFNSELCYAYRDSDKRFDPLKLAVNRRCDGDSWSGNLLNYITMSRVDILRKTLYGGKRQGNNSSILERSNLPNDAHVWGKEMSGNLNGEGNLLDYLPSGFSVKQFNSKSADSIKKWLESGRKIMFANMDTGNYPGVPVFRIAATGTVTGSDEITDWVSSDGNAKLTDNNNADMTSFVVRVSSCTDLDQAAANLQGKLLNCRTYASNNRRPTGLLHKYGVDSDMEFGLLTSSYDKPADGGVLRVAVRQFANEINSETGDFANDGIANTIDKLRIYKPDGSYSAGDGNWGNPVAEMYYEAVRYLSGMNAPVYIPSIGSRDTALGLKGQFSWVNPYASRPWCAKPYITVISDAVTSFDTNIPGTAYSGGATVTDPKGLSVSTLAKTLWDLEFGAASKNVMIGSVAGGVEDGLPTGKTVNDFNIRGISPEEPTRQGSFYAAMLAYYARTTPLITAIVPSGYEKPRINTFSIAMSTPIPSVELNMNGKIVSIVPYGKVVSGASNTLSIVDYYLRPSSLACSWPDCYRFRVNFDDAEDGADYDMDDIVDYTIRKSGGRVRVIVESVSAATGYRNHMGFVISGVKPLAANDAFAGGAYLVVRENESGSNGQCVSSVQGEAGYNALNFGMVPGASAGCSVLPLIFDREFEVESSREVVTRLKSPLWYIAKYGGFTDNRNPASGAHSFDNSKTYQWDADADGVPDNYAAATNPLKLEQQLDRTFQSISNQSGSLSAGTGSSIRVLGNSLYFETSYDSRNWSGDVKAYPVKVNPGRELFIDPAATPLWSAAANLKSDKRSGASDRVLIAGNPGVGSAVIPFRGTALTDAGLIARLRDGRETDNSRALQRVQYLRGNAALEGEATGLLRPRPDTKLGDFLQSAPLYVGQPRFGMARSSEYITFHNAFIDNPRANALYVGGNSGFLHAFGVDKSGGEGAELWGFMPKVLLESARSRLVETTRQNYTNPLHQNFVNGQQYWSEAQLGEGWRSLLTGALGSGGREVYLLDVTRPEAVTEANAASLVQWEFTGSDDADLGYVFGKPYVVKLNDGQWYVITANGYNSGQPASSKAGLFVLPVLRPTSGWVNRSNNGTGSNYFKLMTSVMGENGLSSIRPVDLDKDGRVDLVFAGDLRGNVWKFDLSGDTPQSWGVALNNRPLFSAVSADVNGRVQPIVVAPEVVFLRQRRPSVPTVDNSGLMVFVGTGKFLENCDRVAGSCGNGGLRALESAVNSVYGLWDYGGVICARGELQVQTLTQYSHAGKNYRKASNNVLKYPAAGVQDVPCHSVSGARRTSLSTSATATEQNTFPFQDYKLGWYQDLPLGGERVISDLTITAKQLQYLTYLPETSSSNACVTTARGFFMALNGATGGAMGKSTIAVPATVAAGDAMAITGLEVKPAFGYTLFDAPPDGQLYGSLQRAYLPFVPGYNGEGCANNVRTNAGEHIRLNDGASCARTLQRVTWREVIEE